nr:hypothetical protein [Pandoravirus massiliensis]
MLFDAFRAALSNEWNRTPPPTIDCVFCHLFFLDAFLPPFVRALVRDAVAGNTHHTTKDEKKADFTVSPCKCHMRTERTGLFFGPICVAVGKKSKTKTEKVVGGCARTHEKVAWRDQKKFAYLFFLCLLVCKERPMGVHNFFIFFLARWGWRPTRERRSCCPRASDCVRTCSRQTLKRSKRAMGGS